jgi:hypothetical protein
MKTMIRRLMILAVGCMLSLGWRTVSLGAAGGVTAKAAFEKLKGLNGEWRGTVDQKGSGPEIAVQYRTTSNGTVVMESLFAGTDHEMVTLYHLEGEKLVLIHYCAMGNQPKMAMTKASTAEKLEFDFVGGANIEPKSDTHMHSARIEFESADAITGEWDTFKGGKKTGSHKFFLTRKSPPGRESAAK